MKIQKLLLVAPNPQGPGPGRYKPLFPPLALTQLEALTPTDHIEVKIIDEAVQPIDFSLPPDIVGITVSMTAARPRAIAIASEFRSRGVPVVFGGVDPTLSTQDYKPYADFIFRGEAEGSWRLFLEHLQHGGTPQIFNAEHFPELDDLVIPSRKDLNPRDYAYFNTLQTARGCPNKCDFCSVWVFSGRRLRTRPISHVILEIESLPPGPLVFVNDNIMADFDYAEELFKALMPIGRPWFGQADMTLLARPDLVRLAAKSGCAVLFVGFESFNPESLTSANKLINDIGKYGEFVRLLHRHGISVIPANIFGFDSDTVGEFERCYRELHRMKADAPQFSILTPLPGTRLYRRLANQWKIIRKDPGLLDGTKAVFQPAQMTIEELENGLRDLYRRYYRLRGIIWRLISDPWFWRHPLRRLNFLRLLYGHFVPRILFWARRSRKP